MAKGTTVKMWRRTLIVLIVMVAFRFRFNCGQPNPPAIGRWCRTAKSGCRPAIKRYNHKRPTRKQFMIEI